MLVLIAVLIAAGLPVAEPHAAEARLDGHATAVAADLHGHAPTHELDSVPASDGGHVHLHQCCPHVQSAPVPQLFADWRRDEYAPTLTSGRLLAGSLSPPFRPPAR